MKYLTKIIEYFFPPFTYDDDKFVLKHEPTWFSNRYRCVLYSGNGGKTFKKIKKADQPLFTHGDYILEYNWSYDYYYFNIEDTAFKNIKEEFKSLKYIEDFMGKEYQRFLKGREEVEESRKQYRELIKRNSE